MYGLNIMFRISKSKELHDVLSLEIILLKHVNGIKSVKETCTYIFSISCRFLSLKKEKKKEIISSDYILILIFLISFFCVIWQATKLLDKEYKNGKIVFDLMLWKNENKAGLKSSPFKRSNNVAFDTLNPCHYLCNLLDS